MGMDVFGINPDSQIGEYFRANIWYWRPLWGYVENNFPEIALKVPDAYVNAGDGLDAHDSFLLGEKIYHHVNGGLAKDYEQDFNAAIAELPLIPCTLCHGTGQRVWPPHITQDWIQTYNGCNGCSGTGLERDSSSWYIFSAELLEEFSSFLIHCGGFQIW